MPTNENSLTVRHKGEDYVLDLNEKDADSLAEYVQLVKDVPHDDDKPRPKEHIDARFKLRQSFSDSATLGEISAKLVDLDKDSLIHVNALVLLMTAGSVREEGGNWILEVVKDLLYDVEFEGVICANEQDPRSALASIAGAIGGFWYWIHGAKMLAERHPRLFSAPPAAMESVAIPKRAKRQRAGKPRKAA